MVWTDIMLIPMHAQNPVDAMKWMNFYYQPKIGAEVADWVNYVTPVQHASRSLQKSIRPWATARSCSRRKAMAQADPSVLRVQELRRFQRLE